PRGRETGNAAADDDDPLQSGAPDGNDSAWEIPLPIATTSVIAIILLRRFTPCPHQLPKRLTIPRHNASLSRVISLSTARRATAVCTITSLSSGSMNSACP